MRVSIAITTSNRLEELKRTFQMLEKLNPSPEEILITADGCTDGTAEFFSEMSNVKLVVNSPARGSVASRDRMVREARGDLVLTLDDDSYPEEADCIDRIIPFFKQRPKLAVLHFPQRTDEYPFTIAQKDFGCEKATRSFASSGAVLRRSIYLKLPGFEPRFHHMYEEPDYGLQCVAAGYDVLYSPVLKIRHHYSGQSRDEIRIHHYHARNEFWSILMRCPLLFAPGMVTWRVFSQFRYAFRRGWAWLLREPAWWLHALAGIRYCLGKRRAVSLTAYRRWLKLP